MHLPSPLATRCPSCFFVGEGLSICFLFNVERLMFRVFRFFVPPYTQVWQNVFKAMLGETDFFDEFSGTQFDTVATVLLATYLVIMTIMMLNLLVAVLSTAHARVDQNADQEYKVQGHMPHIYTRLSVQRLERCLQQTKPRH